VSDYPSFSFEIGDLVRAKGRAGRITKRTAAHEGLNAAFYTIVLPDGTVLREWAVYVSRVSDLDAFVIEAGLGDGRDLRQVTASNG
jgi:hypothetical protein